MNYDELADRQRRSALALTLLDRHAHARSICSRAYYATYALLSARAPASFRPKNPGWMNFDHTQIPGIVDQLRGLTHQEKAEIKAALTRLKDSRTASDYHPHIDVDGAEARDRLRDCVTVLVKIRHG